MDTNSLEGAVIFCDFEKAFDTVEINFVRKMLKKLNFGPQFITWIDTFYQNIDSCVKCNNWISKAFRVTRGIRQGCPVSALIFILAAEILAIKIRKDKEIKGIQIPSAEVKLSQLADDTTVFTMDDKSIINALEQIKRFGEVAGPQLNMKKTKGIWLGSLKDSKKEVGNISWTTDPVKTLGVYFGHDKKAKEKLNWDDKLCKIKHSFDQWRKRNITLVGRITIIKTFAISKIVYLATALECPSHYIKQINQVIFNFLWNGKRDKIKRNTMIMCREEGGLNMVDFKLQEKALKVTMLKRILEPGSENWKVLPRHYIEKAGSLLLHLESCPDKQILHIIPPYYADIIKAWYACKGRTHIDTTGNSARVIREQIIWGNQNITYKGKKLWFKAWINSNVIYVNDIFDENGVFNEVYLYGCIKDKTNLIAELYMLKNAIKQEWKQSLSEDPCKLWIKACTKPCLVIKNKLIEIDALSSKTVYWCLVNKYKKHSSAEVYWREIFNGKNILWTNVYNEKLKNVSEQKIVAFNFKLLNNVIATPHKLFKWKIIESNTCHLCFCEGTLEHMMLKCSYFSNYYEYVKLALNQIGYENVNLDMYTLICGHKPDIVEYNAINLILNIVFFNVYKCWVKVKIDRKYINPIHNLYYELNNRCQTKTYCNNLFCKFRNIIKM